MRSDSSVEFVDLSHVIDDGMSTYPGLPGPVICDFMSFDDSHSRYSEGTEFTIGRIDTYFQHSDQNTFPARNITDLWSRDVLQVNAIFLAGRNRNGFHDNTLDRRGC